MKKYRATIYQPQYFPRLHYFNRALDSDFFIILDNAQFIKSLLHRTESGKERHTSYQSATPIKNHFQLNLLNIPVRHNGYFPINEAKIDYSQKWQTQHLASINLFYKKASRFDHIFPGIEKIIASGHDTLADLDIISFLWGINELLGFNIEPGKLTIEKINRKLDCDNSFRLKKIILGSELGVQRPDGIQKGTEWTTEICKKIGASEYYYGGTALAGYMDLNYYKNNGITPIIQDWRCIPYSQQSPKSGFIPNLSIVDLLLNVSPSTAKNILVGNKYPRLI